MIVPDPDLARRRLQAGRALFPTDPRTMTRLRRLSRRDSDISAKRFAEVETWCTFIGYAASGHSLVASLLDAHPEIAIAHELDALAFIAAGFDFPQIVSLAISNAATFAKLGRRWRGFDYTVPGQWQGRFARLRVVGDKKAGLSSLVLGRDLPLLQKMATVVPVRRRFLHVIRNPFDNISTLALRRKISPESGIPVEQIRSYLRLHRYNRHIIESIGEEAVCNIYHETMIADPKGELARICRFLGVEASDDYLAACASIVFRSPSLSRHKMAWKPATIAALEHRLALDPLLAHYRYEVP